MAEDNEDSPTAATPPGGMQARPPVEAGGSLPPPPPPPPGYMYPPPPPQHRGRSMAGRLFVSLLTALLLCSIILNGYLGVYFVRTTSGPWEATYEDGEAGQRIAVIPVTGLINEKTAWFVRSALQHLRSDPPAAIILRVDSGGGLIGACDMIWHELKRFKDAEPTKGIPIVASFGTVAASGGYYVSALADHIIAEPVTVTGSIGVMAPIFTIDRLLDKVGITPEVLVAPKSPNKDLANNIARPWTDKDRNKIREQLNRAHDRFVTVVFEGRREKLGNRQTAEDLASGDVYSTEEAIKLKLVDSEGYMDSAIAQAMALAKIDPTVQPKVTIIKPPYSLNLLNFVGGRQDAPTSLSAAQVRDWLWELATPRLAYRMWP